MNLKTAIAIAVAAAFAVPLAAQASADADKIIVAQQAGSTYEPKDSNPAAPPKAMGPGAGSTNSQTGEVNKDRPARSAAGGQSSPSSTTGATNAPITSGTNSAFSGLDKNHDGYISRDEARDATWSNRFTELDKDNDGRLSQSEFNAMQAGAGATGSNAGRTNAPATSGTNSADRKPNTPKQ